MLQSRILNIANMSFLTLLAREIICEFTVILIALIFQKVAKTEEVVYHCGIWFSMMKTSRFLLKFLLMINAAIVVVHVS